LIGLSMLACMTLAGALQSTVLGLSRQLPTDGGAQRRQVVLYYANETSLAASASENYRALLVALRAAGNEAGTEIARSIESDSHVFRTVVQKDLADLLVAARRLGLDLAFFDNDKALKGQFAHLGRGSGEMRLLPLPALPPTANPILETSPLSRPEALRAALSAVAALYPGQDLDIVLITFSHGSSKMAIIPRVSTNLTTPDAQREFLQQLSGSEHAQPAAWAKIQGIDRNEYWQILAEASQSTRIKFPLVFRQSCASGLQSWSELLALPGSVAALAHSGLHNMHLKQIDYGTMFVGSSEEGNWLEAFKSRLAASNVYVETRRTLWVAPTLTELASVSLFYYFVPLLAWLAWLASWLWLALSHRQRKARS
jgi:hypothetical protein